MKLVNLLTGRPGTGKTSLIKEAVSGLGDRAGGFYTEEIRVQGEREGFRIVSLDGPSAVLAHTGTGSPYRVSKYGVDLQSMENVGVSSLERALRSCQVVVVDEIGRMELFSDRFKQTVLEIVNSGKKVIGTVLLKPDPWVDSLKADPRVNLIVLTRANRDTVLSDLREWLKS
jgi:nucleoside-triphosphatase